MSGFESFLAQRVRAQLIDRLPIVTVNLCHRFVISQADEIFHRTGFDLASVSALVR